MTSPSTLTTPAEVAAQVVGVDVGTRHLRAADALAATVFALLAEQGGSTGAVVATHLTRLGDLPHVTLSVEAPALGAARLAELLAGALPDAAVCGGTAAGPAPSRENRTCSAAAAAAGAQAHATRTGGRAVHYPGSARLVGTVTVADLLACSAIAAVRVLGSAGPPAGDVVVRTRDHVRPAYEGGQLVLTAEWAAGPALVPFETPNPTPCCAEHA